MLIYNLAAIPWVPPLGGIPEGMIVPSLPIFAVLWLLLFGLLVASAFGLWLAAHRGTGRFIMTSVEPLVVGWRRGRGWVSGHALLVEAKAFVASARRLAGEGDLLAAENELEAAAEDTLEAAARLPAGDAHLTDIRIEIGVVATIVRSRARDMSRNFERALARRMRLVDEIEEALHATPARA
jgi:hypothetical protein